MAWLSMTGWTSRSAGMFLSWRRKARHFQGPVAPPAGLLAGPNSKDYSPASLGALICRRSAGVELRTLDSIVSHFGRAKAQGFFGSAARPWPAIALLVLVCIMALLLRLEKIESSMPYPRGVNEFVITEPAKRILQTGDFHPGTFRYPSLPTYIATGAMALGFIRAAADQELRAVQEIGNVYYPYYSVPTVVGTARQVYALLSVLAIAAAGVAAYSIVPRPSALVLPPLALSLSPYFFEMSWRYLNVDIVGASLVGIGMAAMMRGITRPNISPIVWIATVPAICTGLAAASKYTYGLLVVSVCFAIVLFVPRQRRAAALAIAGATVAASFIVAFPYALLDLPKFLNGLAFEVTHYATGHVGQDGEAGLPKLAFYGSHLMRDFGLVALGTAFVGLAWIGRSDWRKLVVFLSFPVLLLAILSTRRVEFFRNVLPLLPFIAIAVAAGIVALSQWARAFFASGSRFRVLVTAAVPPVLFVTSLHVPLASFPDQWAPVRESRREAVEWIVQNIPRDRTLIIPVELELRTSELEEEGFAVVLRPFKRLYTQGAYRKAAEAIEGPAVFLVPKWRADPRFPDGELARRLDNAASRATMDLRSFEGGMLKVNYPRTVTEGNPAIAIAELKPSHKGLLPSSS